jgi:hypothetical protein
LLHNIKEKRVDCIGKLIKFGANIEATSQEKDFYSQQYYSVFDFAIGTPEFHTKEIHLVMAAILFESGANIFNVVPRMRGYVRNRLLKGFESLELKQKLMSISAPPGLDEHFDPAPTNGLEKYPYLVEAIEE